MTEEILDRDLDDDAVTLRMLAHFNKWAKRWSWISVIILFLFVFFSGILIPVFNSRSESPYQFLNRTLIMIGVFLILLTISNSLSLYYRWRGFSMLTTRSERHYFNLFISILFLLAPILLVLLVFGL